MKWIEGTIIGLLIVGLAITEYHTYLFYRWSFTEKLVYDKWMNEKYTKGIPLLYFLYEIEPILKEIIWLSLWAIMANFGFKRVRNVLIVLILYYCTQLGFYLWQRNTSSFANLIVYLYMGLAIIAPLIPSKRSGKLIIMEYYNNDF